MAARAAPDRGPAGGGFRRRLREELRAAGALSLVRRGVRRLLRPLLRVERWHFVEVDLRQDLPRFQARVPVTIGPGTPEDLEACAEGLAAVGLDAADARRQLEGGDVVLLARAPDGRLAGLVWATWSDVWVDELGVRLVLGPGEQAAYQAVTLPEWRGQGVAPALYAAICAYGAARGAVRQIAWTAGANRANLRSNRRLGARWTKTVWAIWVRGMARPRLVGATAAGSPSLVRR